MDGYRSWLLRAVLVLAPVTGAPAAEAPGFDVIVANGHVVDGTGSPWYAADIGISGGHIAAIGRLGGAAAGHRIDATGKVVAPGFIDMLGQSDLTMLVDPRVPSKIYQGITTEITGEGESAGPLDEAIVAANHEVYAHYRIAPDWRTLGQYFTRLERHGMGINLASYVGAATVRRIVLGDADVQPTAEQLARMTALVDAAMRDGAVGVSTALEYAPAPYARTEELIALASAASRFGGIYATHMRSEGDGIMAALDETFRIGREAGLPVQIFHLKVAGRANFGHMPEIVARIERARADGLDVSANTYAYTAWSNDLSAFVPPWAHDGGLASMVLRLKDPAMRRQIRRDMLAHGKDSHGEAWDNEWQEIAGPEAILIAQVTERTLLPIQGETLAAIATAWHEDPVEALFDILVRDNGLTGVSVFGMDERDVVLALRQPWVSVDNDSSGTSPEGILGEEHPHPRAYGTFPRILRKYVREEHALTLPDAIRKFAALPAAQLRLADRGVLKQGMWADLVIFDADRITDKATYENPNQYSAGIEDVLVNGVPVLEGGQMTGTLPGKVLRGPGYQN
jgi:dihydroorotase/N-acyl-D-amino-acid deacylase